MATNFELADDDEETGMTAGNDEIVDLLQRRDAIQGWLDRLDDQRGTANAKVLDKVRADYQARLQATLEVLASHRETIAAELASAEDRLRAAEGERADSGDLLEEAHLRHRIGELSEDEWATRREQLEAAVERALEVERESAADVDRLRDLIAQLDEREAKSEAADDFESLIISGPEATLESPKPAFLTDIDRALTDEAVDTEDVTGDAEPEEDTSPKAGLKCPECGYTNDISAWFCGVCGADIG